MNLTIEGTHEARKLANKISGRRFLAAEIDRPVYGDDAVSKFYKNYIDSGEFIFVRAADNAIYKNDFNDFINNIKNNGVKLYHNPLEGIENSYTTVELELVKKYGEYIEKVNEYFMGEGERILNIK